MRPEASSQKRSQQQSVNPEAVAELIKGETVFDVDVKPGAMVKGITCLPS